MKADLILAQKQLKLKPPLEELKTLYFKEGWFQNCSKEPDLVPPRQEKPNRRL